MLDRILTTDAAQQIIASLAKEHGELVFVLSGGCCDGARPMCLEKTDYRVKARDVLFGQVSGFDFYVDSQLAQNWLDCQLTLDVIDCPADSFSLEAEMDKAFMLRSRKLTGKDLEHLPPLDIKG